MVSGDSSPEESVPSDGLKAAGELAFQAEGSSATSDLNVVSHSTHNSKPDANTGSPKAAPPCQPQNGGPLLKILSSFSVTKT